MITILGHQVRKHSISFYNSGRIDINASLSKSLQLSIGDVIDVALHNGEYYIYVRYRAEEISGEYTAKCYPSKRGVQCPHPNMRVNCKDICNVFLKLQPMRRGKVSFAVGDPCSIKNIKLAVPIITRLDITRTQYEHYGTGQGH